MLAVVLAQILSVSVSATFTVLSGQVTGLSYEFREDLYTPVSSRFTSEPASACLLG